MIGVLGLESALKGYTGLGQMIGVLGNDSALEGYTSLGTTEANEINFVMNLTPGAGSIDQPVDQQLSMLQLSYGWPQIMGND